ncbi:RNA polymerase sigma-I factor [Ureibacillus acetophenoni]|uniref:RNA polymerase sigma factor SigI n=1 Tax=Ureibacillus acetophenoni TaxID=614649 RepID=A0A285U9Z5_9BACL|nr:RNA polymerase sigma-I factor [Ureibacillus acetophenoni]SOC37386.1 RNA polymerase sigma factor [Ureibacillus acetophenoni]
MLLSIIQGLFKPKLNITELAKKAKAGNEEVMNDLLSFSKPFMKKTASYICKRPIDEHDEEYSITILGFHEAVMSFNPEENASFQTFAHLIIKRRLIDYIRKETARKDQLLSLEPNEDDSSEQHFLFNEKSIYTYEEKQRSATRKEELLIYRELLSGFNLSFEDLTKTSPKHVDARKTAFHIAQIVADHEEFYNYLLKNKRLPLKEIESLVEVSRKTLERHRKYIIAVVLLLNSDFIYLKDYVKGEII